MRLKHQKETSSTFPNISGWIVDLKEKRFKLAGGLSPLNICSSTGITIPLLLGWQKMRRLNNHRWHLPVLKGEIPMFKNDFPSFFDDKTAPTISNCSRRLIEVSPQRQAPQSLWKFQQLQALIEARAQGQVFQGPGPGPRPSVHVQRCVGNTWPIRNLDEHGCGWNHKWTRDAWSSNLWGTPKTWPIPLCSLSTSERWLKTPI